MTISQRTTSSAEKAGYGSEDLTPSEFYKEDDAATALSQARMLHETVRKALSG